MRRYKGTPTPAWLPLAVGVVLALAVIIALLRAILGL
jgi:hypothetical protein